MPLDIPVNVNDRRIRYAPGAGTSTFDFDFPIFDKSHLKVERIRSATVTELVLDLDYTIPDADVDTEDGGTITLISGDSLAGDVYVLSGDIPLERTSDYAQLGVIPARQLNEDLDLLWMKLQEQQTDLDRVIRVGSDQVAPVGEIVGEPTAGNMIRRNSGNDGWEYFSSFGAGVVTLPLSLANGGTGANHASVASLFNAIKQAASEAASGAAEIATQTEVNAGADDARIVTPLKLWTTPMRGGWRNIMGANGGFEIASRGAGGVASFAVPASTIAYTFDRWYLSTGVNQASVVAQQAGLTDGSQFCARVQRNAAQAGTTQMWFGYPLDSDEIAKLRNKRATVRFTVRAGANWSPASGTLFVSLMTGTGVPKKFITGFTGGADALGGSVGLTPGGITLSPSRTTAGVIPAATTQAELVFSWIPTLAAGANDWFEIDDVDLRAEEPVIDQVERWPFWDAMRACQGHFEKSFLYGVAPAQGIGNASAIKWSAFVAGAVASFWPFKLTTEKRVTPTITTFNPLAANSQVRNDSDGADFSGTTPINITPLGFWLQYTQTAGTAVNEGLTIHYTADAGI